MWHHFWRFQPRWKRGISRLPVLELPPCVVLRAQHTPSHRRSASKKSRRAQPLRCKAICHGSHDIPTFGLNISKDISKHLLRHTSCKSNLPMVQKNQGVFNVSPSFTLRPGQPCQALISPSQRRFCVNKKLELQHQRMHSKMHKHLNSTNACMQREHIANADFKWRWNGGTIKS